MLELKTKENYRGLQVLSSMPKIGESTINGEVVIGYKKDKIRDENYDIFIVKTMKGMFYHTLRYAIENKRL